MSYAWFQVEVALKPIPLPMSQLQGLRVDVSKSLSIRLEPIGRFGLDEISVEPRLII